MELNIPSEGAAAHSAGVVSGRYPAPKNLSCQGVVLKPPETDSTRIADVRYSADAILTLGFMNLNLLAHD